jgi:hypothetical protein
MEQKEFWVDVDCSFKIKASSEEVAINKAIAILGDNGGRYINVSDVEEIKE